MGDGVLLTRMFAVLVIAWPPVAAGMVYAVRRSRVVRVTRYFIAATLFGYVASFLFPVLALVTFMALGRVAEVATVYTLLLSIPVLFLLPPSIAVYWSTRCGPPVPEVDRNLA